jgi:hypothetical protein
MTKFEVQGFGLTTLKSNVTPDSQNANWLFFQDAHVQMAKPLHPTGNIHFSEPGFDPGT